MRSHVTAAIALALVLSGCGASPDSSPRTVVGQSPGGSASPMGDEASPPLGLEPGATVTPAAVPLDFLTFDLTVADPELSEDLLGLRATYKVDQHLLPYEQVVDDPEWGPLASLCWKSSDSATQRYGFVRAEVGFTVDEHGTFDTSGGLELPMGPAPGVKLGTADASKAMTFATDYTTPECRDGSWMDPYGGNAGGRILNFGYLMERGRTHWGPVRVLLGVPYAFSPQAPNGDLRQIEQYSYLVVGVLNDSREALLKNSDGEYRKAAKAKVVGPMTAVEGKPYPDAFQKIKAGLS